MRIVMQVAGALVAALGALALAGEIAGCTMLAAKGLEPTGETTGILVGVALVAGGVGLAVAGRWARTKAGDPRAAAMAGDVEVRRPLTGDILVLLATPVAVAATILPFWYEEGWTWGAPNLWFYRDFLLSFHEDRRVWLLFTLPVAALAILCVVAGVLSILRLTRSVRVRVPQVAIGGTILVLWAVIVLSPVEDVPYGEVLQHTFQGLGTWMSLAASLFVVTGALIGRDHSEDHVGAARAEARASTRACPSCGRDSPGGNQFCLGCGQLLPTTTVPAQQAGGPRIVATFGPTTGWVGRSIAIDDQQFVLEGHGPVTAAAILEYDRLGQLGWAADAGLRPWVESVAAAEESHSAAPEVDHATSTSPRHDLAGETSLELPRRGPVSPFEWLSPEERRWLVEGIADTRTDRTLPLLSMLAEDENSSVAAAAVQAAARVRANPRRPSRSSRSGLLPVAEAVQAMRGRRRKHQLRGLGRCIGNPTEHNVSVLTMLASGPDDAARQARKALEVLALWSEATSTASSAGGEMPRTSPRPAVVVATFGPSTGWVGKTIAYENQQFVLEGHGPTSAEGVLEYDRQGHLVWAYLGLREWVQGIVATRQATPAPPPTTHDDRTQAGRSADPVLPTTTAPARLSVRTNKGNRTRITVVLCTVVVLAGAMAAIFFVNQRHQQSEQVKRQAAALVGQAKAADKLGSEVDSAATDFTNSVAGVESALLRNAAAVKAWKKTWAKRSAAYDTKAAAVNAYNRSPAGQRRWVPNVRTVYYETSRPGFLLYEEPSIPREDVWYADGFMCDGVYIDKIVTRRSSRPVGGPHKLPRPPKKPARIKDPARHSRDELADLKVQLGTLVAELDVAKLGPEFLSVADEIRNGIEVLRTKVDLALKACDEAVHHDPKIGYVAVPKKFKRVDLAGVHQAVQVVRESLVDAARINGIDLSELTWASTQP